MLLKDCPRLWLLERLACEVAGLERLGLRWLGL